MTRTALLVDFGGVLTTSVLMAFEDFGVSVGAARGLLLELLSNDAACRKLLVEHESGRIDADAFDRGFAVRLHAHGVALLLRLAGVGGAPRDVHRVRLPRPSLGVPPQVDDLELGSPEALTKPRRQRLGDCSQIAHAGTREADLAVKPAASGPS